MSKHYQEGKYHVGSLNYDPELQDSFNFPPDKRIRIIDSTMRKLEYTPGLRLSVQDKVDIALKSEELGVDEIYINNIHYLPEIFESTKAIAEQRSKLILNTQTSLAEEGWQEGVKKSVEVKADKVEVETKASDIELCRFGLTRDGMIKRMCEALDFGKDLGADMTTGFTDSTRSDFSFLMEIINKALEHGASKLIMYDTFGNLGPDAMRLLIRRIREHWIREVPIAVHVHNMFGLGTAGALAAVTGGATHVDVAVNGFPTNDPLAFLEETVLALELILGLSTGVHLEKIYDYCRFVEEKSGIRIAPFKAVVGDHIFLSETDAHITAHFRSARIENLTPFAPELVGQKAKVVWGINSLRGNSIRALLESKGWEYSEDQISEILQIISGRLDQKTGYPVWLTQPEVEEICLRVLNK